MSRGEGPAEDTPTFRTLVCEGGEKSEEKIEEWKQIGKEELQEIKRDLKEKYSGRRSSVREYCKSHGENVTEKIQKLWRSRIW